MTWQLIHLFKAFNLIVFSLLSELCDHHCCLVAKQCPIFVTLQTIAHQAPLSVGFPSKNTGVGCHFYLQGIFLDQGLNPHLLHWQADSLPLSHLGNIIYLNKINSKQFKWTIFLTFQKQAMRSLHLVQSHHCYLKSKVILFFKHHNYSLDFTFKKYSSCAFSHYLLVNIHISILHSNIIVLDLFCNILEQS